MDEFVGVLIAALAMAARFALFVIFEVVWEILVKRVICDLLWLIWPNRREGAGEEPIARASHLGSVQSGGRSSVSGDAS